ncbi:MotA/TolQ/ExbB proton channel family protein [Microbulbifer thermotolerans]|uniref:Energy transducer TonB n=1 Tax=Microbulbifer thermotolerans TaxID=252514 RepID=A0A143HQI0_MICTH|nr:MotA/TolQ/ExbB proton channel family protein [Microbulbifer thermotolerans]AMX03542.1 energy transducer TonB [Microbulbifer thermotolerans]MCX2778165.1 MotA/TolQ/ExbB proton channel family protein [Microbulbifer thermotolerans]MCX2782201.1 MotA/TolQ/ExbB proton channel family protein [Microbulbifer thermotolerans]MCX2795293.1 MotA/TolQ/ExbB proton channel family protein [Microbulbifer thermotolerans]MCX2801145.1 MotA/TolQ/ExbB proton channel family protein [Microbulbifer thermotolerans]
MKTSIAKRVIVAAAAGLISFSAVAQDKATSLDQLLKMVQQSKIAESKEHKQREAEFRRQKANQQALLTKAKNTRAAEEARSERLEQKYQEQEVMVQQKRQQLDERLGSLKELFGHLTSTAGDLRANLDNSIVSAQYPGRTEFIDTLIDKMNSATKLPTIEEIERLWYELQRETVESGKVVKFTATVIKPDGEQVEQEVVRVGNFNLVSNGKYLEMLEGYKLAELVRQPDGKYLSMAQNLQNASAGFTAFGVDPTGPTGGSYLKAMINSPSLVERWHQGGIVGYIITGVGAVAMLLAIWRLIVLSGVSARVNAQLRSSSANTNNPLGRVLAVAEENKGVDGETLELKMEEAVLKERPAIESGLNLLKIIAMVAPLLGLLGTVTGMIITFQAITIFGAGDPKAMAGGISSALVTTVLGLCVAIPTVLMHTIVNGRAKRILHILEEQSAGIVAENAERN